MRKLLITSFLFTCVAHAANICEITGCNGELCLAKGEGKLSTCFWKAEYQCYKQLGICEPDANGICGWRQTPELMACITQAQNAVERADQYSD